MIAMCRVHGGCHAMRDSRQETSKWSGILETRAAALKRDPQTAKASSVKRSSPAPKC
jgi:hypothetical protein